MARIELHLGRGEKSTLVEPSTLPGILGTPKHSPHVLNIPRTFKNITDDVQTALGETQLGDASEPLHIGLLPAKDVVLVTIPMLFDCFSDRRYPKEEIFTPQAKANTRFQVALARALESLDQEETSDEDTILQYVLRNTGFWRQLRSQTRYPGVFAFFTIAHPKGFLYGDGERGLAQLLPNQLGSGWATIATALSVPVL